MRLLHFTKRLELHSIYYIHIMLATEKSCSAGLSPPARCARPQEQINLIHSESIQCTRNSLTGSGEYRFFRGRIKERTQTRISTITIPAHYSHRAFCQVVNLTGGIDIQNLTPSLKTNMR